MSDNEAGSDNEAEAPKKGKGTKRKAKKEKKGPKRALSAYMFFCKAKRSDTKESNPKASFAEIGKMLGDQWQKMDEDEKKPFAKQNEKDKERYAKEKAEFPEEDDADDDGGSKKKKTKTGKKKKDPDAPKNAKSAYMFFCVDERKRLKEADPGLSFAEVGTQMGANWKALTDDAKTPYVQLNKDAKKKHAAEKEKYEAEHGKPDKKEKAKKTKGKKKPAAAEDDGDADADADADAPAGDDAGDDAGGDD